MKCRSNTQGIQSRSKVIRNDTIADPIGTDSHSDNDEETVAVILVEEIGILDLSTRLFGFNTLNDLVVLELNQRIAGIAIGVVIGKNLES